ETHLALPLAQGRPSAVASRPQRAARPAACSVATRKTGICGAICSNSSTGARRSTGTWGRAPGAKARSAAELAVGLFTPEPIASTGTLDLSRSARTRLHCTSRPPGRARIVCAYVEPYGRLVATPSTAHLPQASPPNAHTECHPMTTGRRAHIGTSALVASKARNAGSGAHGQTSPGCVAAARGCDRRGAGPPIQRGETQGTPSGLGRGGSLGVLCTVGRESLAEFRPTERTPPVNRPRPRVGLVRHKVLGSRTPGPEHRGSLRCARSGSPHQGGRDAAGPSWGSSFVLCVAPSWHHRLAARRSIVRRRRRIKKHDDYHHQRDWRWWRLRWWWWCQFRWW